MKKYKQIIGWSFSLLLVLSCSDASIPAPEIQPKPDVDAPTTIDIVHPNVRDKVYPKNDNELYLNPAPLLVPEKFRAQNESLQFQLSKDESFQSKETIKSEPLAWNMFNPHQRLEKGTWYWRYRTIDANGKMKPWSETISFTVKGSELIFVTPSFSSLENKIPHSYPRIHYFLQKDMDKVKPQIKNHPEYTMLLGRAKQGMNYNLPSSNPYNEANKLSQMVFNYLYPAYLLTDDQQYADKIIEFTRTLIASPVTDQQLFKDNFYSADVVDILSTAYDIGQNTLSVAEKNTIVELLQRIVNHYFSAYKGSLENHVFDNHTWQAVMRSMLQASLVLYYEVPEAKIAFEYFYELWTARAPATGFNRDGGWINGMKYFEANIYTLHYVPMLFSDLSGVDFLQHPWYQQAGQTMTYAWLPNSSSTSFGDGVESSDAPTRVQIAFADFLARENRDSYAAWYVKNTGNDLRNDYLLRLYRMARSHIKYDNSVADESGFTNFKWNKDMGEGIAFSDMTNPKNNLSLAFRSSPFGSGSHTLADQNSFKLLYKGTYVYMNAGYYQNFSDKHNLLQYRHTRGHNTILVNGIGQPFTTRAYGDVSRALNGDNIAYFMGDASNAYCGISEYPLWINNFKKAGISQTPKYGFGETTLNNYKRHIFMLRPNIVVVYDELAAEKPSTWQWLLHSPTQFNVEGNKITSQYISNQGAFTATTHLFSGNKLSIDVTNAWYAGAEPSKGGAKQWHLTASHPQSATSRFLAIIQVTDGNKVSKIEELNGQYKIGEWVIKAELNGGQPAAITILNEKKGTAFNYGNSSVQGNSTTITKDATKSLLFDSIKGKPTKQEMGDKPLQVTRSY